MITLYLVRHGETEENVQQILQGHLPGHLTSEGKLQAAQARERLKSMQVHFNAILTSDLQRTLDTADIINRKFCLPIYPTKLLRERDWGSATGCLIKDVKENGVPEDAESLQTMYQRAGEFLENIKKRFNEMTLLIVSHGLFLRVLQATVLGCDKSQVPRMGNAEIKKIDLEDFSCGGEIMGEEISSS